MVTITFCPRTVVDKESVFLRGCWTTCARCCCRKMRPIIGLHGRTETSFCRAAQLVLRLGAGSVLVAAGRGSVRWWYVQVGQVQVKCEVCLAQQHAWADR